MGNNSTEWQGSMPQFLKDLMMYDSCMHKCGPSKMFNPSWTASLKSAETEKMDINKQFPEQQTKKGGDNMGSSKIDRYDTIAQGLRDLFIYKNGMYKDSTSTMFKEFGLTSYAIRLSDKLQRLIQMAKIYDSDSTGMDEWLDTLESVIDTLYDLANYSILALIDINGSVPDHEAKHMAISPKVDAIDIRQQQKG